jgi:hypothetical protein
MPRPRIQHSKIGHPNLINHGLSVGDGQCEGDPLGVNEHLYEGATIVRARESCRAGKERVVVPAEVCGAVAPEKGGLETVLVAPGADCADMVGKDGRSDDRSKGERRHSRESCLSVRRTFVKLSANSGWFSIGKDAGEARKATSMFRKRRGPTPDKFGSRSAHRIQKNQSRLTSVDSSSLQECLSHLLCIRYLSKITP